VIKLISKYFEMTVFAICFILFAVAAHAFLNLDPFDPCCPNDSSCIPTATLLDALRPQVLHPSNYQCDCIIEKPLCSELN